MAASASGEVPEAADTKLSVFCCTFNVAGQLPTDLKAWLDVSEANEFGAPDLCVFALQEMDDSVMGLLTGSTGLDAGGNVTDSKAREEAWLTSFDSCVPDYERITSQLLVGMFIVMYAKPDSRPRVSKLATGTVSTGMMGLGNKGAVAIQTIVDGVPVTFINSHLAAHANKVEKRNEDFAMITAKLLEDGLLNLEGACFWMGDLNYRIDEDNDKVRQLIKDDDIETLCHLDQLRTQRLEGNVFDQFNEGQITFPPTYKFDPGTDIYDTSPKARVPSWTDRVLYRAQSPCYVMPHTYRSHPDVKISDHRPVSASFVVSLLEQEATAPFATPSWAKELPATSATAQAKANAGKAGQAIKGGVKDVTSKMQGLAGGFFGKKR